MSACNCEQPAMPTNEDLFVQNTCFSEYGKEWVALPTLEEREQCIHLLACKCNTFCINNCKSTGLDLIWETSCGCARPNLTPQVVEDPVVPEQSEQEEQETQEQDEQVQNQQETQMQSEQETQEQNEQETQEQNEQQTQEQIEQDSVNAIEENIINNLIKLNKVSQDKQISSESILTTTMNAVVGDLASESAFHDLMQGAYDENNNCKPSCWRKCLQMRNETQVFSCVDEWGCGYESPQLLLLQSKLSSDKPETTNIAGSLFFLMIILLWSIAIGMVYVYRRESDHKLHEDLAQEEDVEGGYAKLD